MGEESSEEKGARAFLVRRIAAIAELLVVTLPIATILSFLGRYGWFFDNLANLRHIFVISALFILPVFVWQSRHHFTIVAILVIAANLATFGVALPTAGTACEANLTVAAINALGPDNDANATIAMLKSESVDIVAVTELGDELASLLQTEYPHHHTVSVGGTAGTGLFSRFPLSDVEDLRVTWFPQIIASVNAKGRVFRVHVAHPPPPFMPSTWHLRNKELAAIAMQVRERKGAYVLAGDLNTTRESPYFDDLLAVGLVDSRLGQGVLGTWPHPIPLKVPIDHVLHTNDIQTCELFTTEAHGSDHLPMVARLRY